MSANSNKLAPIYAALDGHQYSRAIKLGLALPSTNLLGRALLAHAYAKSGQRYKALTTLQSILGKDGFPELALEIKYSLERRQQSAAAAATQALLAQHNQQQSSQPQQKGGKGGKKGKKRQPSKSNNNSSATPATAAMMEDQDAMNDMKGFDWIDQLDSPPLLPDNWEEALPTRDDNVPSDTTLLATMSMTLISQRLQLTSFQMYTWAIRNHQNTTNIELVQQTYLAGLTVYIVPHYQSITTQLLSSLQVTALQLARLQQEQLGHSPATAWAAQTGLWQLQHHHHHDNNNNSSPTDVVVDDKKLALLPRLAESLASKAAGEMGHDHVAATENFLLYMRALDAQGKWKKKLQVLRERIQHLDDYPNPRADVLREFVAECLAQLAKDDDDNQKENGGTTTEIITTTTRAECRKETAQLLHLHSDNWEFWKLFLANDDSPGMKESESMINEILEKVQEEQYPLRGPHLARIEREKLLCLKKKLTSTATDKSTTTTVSSLVAQMAAYGKEFAQRASCATGDLSGYIQFVLQEGSVEDAERLLESIQQQGFLTAPSSQDPKERRKELRGYIFGIQMSYHIIVQHTSLSDKWMPPWKDIITAWKDFQAFDIADQAQKENRAADELVLLAVQQLIAHKENKSNKVVAAVILEVAIAYSRHNAYLKIAAMLLYGDLNSARRSWELFRNVFIKHIQHESCSYLILPVLHGGGFYQEIISVCQEILRLQTSAIRDASEYVGRAMDIGTLEKATEFIEFQRTRMNRSLTTLEAKGRVLDCATIFNNVEGEKLGAVHGVVGGPDDLERVQKMISEAHNPHAAFSLLRLKGSSADNLNNFTENRDFDVLSYDILQSNSKRKTPREAVLSDSIRRCHHHSLLIRASLCLDATKGPKKGKLAKNSEELEKRCASLLATIKEASGFSQGDAHQSALYKDAFGVIVCICRAILSVSGGRTEASVEYLDKLEEREEAAAKLLTNSISFTKSIHKFFTAHSEENPVLVVSRFVPDCLVPIYAVFRMCASVLELFGWGKRKRNSRQSAKALVDLSISLTSMISQMKEIIESTLSKSPEVDLSGIDHVVSEDDGKRTKIRIECGQLETKTRIGRILAEMTDTLSTFDVDV
mmetsp:Transcript_3144/g.7896  ORF Transcript_3144/g.7896 Transcript_3144/m.7896 type:complete len:1109 (+) Transcript_3144:106-3432(+)